MGGECWRVIGFITSVGHFSLLVREWVSSLFWGLR